MFKINYKHPIHIRHTVRLGINRCPNCTNLEKRKLKKKTFVVEWAGTRWNNLTVTSAISSFGNSESLLYVNWHHNKLCSRVKAQRRLHFGEFFFLQHDAQRKFWRIFTYINKTHNGKSNAFVSRDWLAQCKFKHMGPQLLTSWGPPSRTTSLFECPRFSEVWNTGPVTSFVGREPIGSQSCGLANGEAVNLTYDFVHVVLALKPPAWILGNVENWFF